MSWITTGKVDDGNGGYAHASDGQPYTTLLYADGPGYRSPRPDLTHTDTGVLIHTNTVML